MSQPTDAELSLLLDTLNEKFDDEDHGTFTLSVEDDVLTIMLEYLDEDDEVTRDVSARWKLTLLDTAAEDYT